MTPRRALADDPTRFAFDAVVRLLQHEAKTADPAQAARFASPPNLTYPTAEIQAIDADEASPEVLTTVIGMTGPSGVLPRGYTETVTVATRDRSPSLHGFLDMVADRFIAQFASAGSKYRIHRAAEEAAHSGEPAIAGRALLALSGYGNAGLGARLDAGDTALQHYAGFFTARPRSAERLAALTSDWLGQNVQVRQFAGAWLTLPDAERSSLPRGKTESGFTQLGVDAAAGVRAWDLQARIVLVVGPLGRRQFEALLPGGKALRSLVGLARAFLGFETGFAVRLVLRADAVPALQLGADGETSARLGWNSWLSARPESRLTDADQAEFVAEVVETTH